MGKFGYDFYFNIDGEVLTLPITPPSLKMSIPSNNKVVTLINEGDINIPKLPGLVEFEFEARFPMRDYPYSRKALNFETYLNTFTALKTEKKPFIFNVIRTTLQGKGTWATVRRVTLEDFEINEDADEGDDVILSFSLKEYKDYGVKTIQTKNSKSNTTSTSSQPRNTDNKATKQETYTIKSGDTLWAIAKKAYGDGSKWYGIYEANKSVIDAEAKKRGKSSSNGNLIFPNTQLVIPPIDKLPTQTKSSSGGSSGTKKSVTLNIKNKGIAAYWGTFEVYINNTYRRGGKASDYSVKLNAGDTVRIVPKGVNGHSYSLSPSSFTITSNVSVTITWSR